ncbi:carbonic anhydrase family protein [Streptomyces ipomoeae]|uniref:carbonic anhydrase n=1 Tax=Streptomyces ipomoeae TaxID=103232 RepID=A0AAE9B272_9ACTN|nr:carbonic anhydrase family protein [Streptomyces ipomoeae]MDX2698522.1 carbonic anhydrase family protein [Streptomyces ipomoeae]MDX2825843.1 carbonic anhydrase family protein [Streptomyces ipomoeae]MDX2844216.1 carbonic anhydrase family protein [Streptomyces ipomoeae]MDX2878524.1 carbonic anhydrase family protein [Streptomyces ipomoeae]TQE18913.1 carbonic anhydrase family protein [Streptomyces ipomoeae]
MSSRVIRMAATAGVAALCVLTVTSCGADHDAEPKGRVNVSASSEAADKTGDKAGEKDDKAGEKKENAHWGYEGADGPANWATLAEDFEACEAGKEQSPIDLDDDKAVDAPVNKAVTIDYRPVTAELVNNGHTIQANVSEGSRIVLDGTTYDLKQFHFHLPSEHTEDGEHSEMEVHFVHADKDGALAVVGVLMDTEDDTDDAKSGGSAFADLFSKLPTEEGATEKVTKAFDLTRFLPGDRDQYRYDGSLTTPPCAEGVKWTVLKESVPVAKDEVATYKELFPKSNRPTQPVNDREITVVEE